MAILHSRFVSRLEHGLDSAREIVLGERLLLMWNKRIYWTGRSTIVVDDEMRLWVKRDARISRYQRVWSGDIGVQSNTGDLTVYFPEGERDRWLPQRLSLADKVELFPVKAALLGDNQISRMDRVTGQALLPEGLEARVVGELEDGERGYIRDRAAVHRGSTIDVETEVAKKSNLVTNLRCERDGTDLLVETKVDGEVRRLKMVGRLVPGRGRLGIKLQRIARGKVESGWDALPTLKDRAPAQRGEPPAVQ